MRHSTLAKHGGRVQDTAAWPVRRRTYAARSAICRHWRCELKEEYMARLAFTRTAHAIPNILRVRVEWPRRDGNQCCGQLWRCVCHVPHD